MPSMAPLLALMQARLLSDEPTYLKVNYTRQWSANPRFRHLMMDVADLFIKKAVPVGYIVKAQVIFHENPTDPVERQRLMDLLETAYDMGEHQAGAYIVECLELGYPRGHHQELLETLQRQSALAGNPQSYWWLAQRALDANDMKTAYDELEAAHHCGQLKATYVLWHFGSHAWHEPIRLGVLEHLPDFLNKKALSQCCDNELDSDAVENTAWGCLLLSEVLEETDPEGSRYYLDWAQKIYPDLLDAQRALAQSWSTCLTD